MLEPYFQLLFTVASTGLPTDVNCGSGYFNLNGQCYQIDSCLQNLIIGNKACGDNESCVHGKDGFKCECNPGFVRNGIHCVHNTKHDTCGKLEARGNSIGSDTCACKSGYRTVCLPSDPCGTGQHNCHDMAICKNTYDGFECICRDGFAGNDGNDCRDLDECQDSIHDCTTTEQCFNTIGSYECRGQ